MVQNLIQTFRERLDKNGGCTEILIAGGNVVEAKSYLNPPATNEDINKLTAHFRSDFPDDYILFLKCCNGANLFADLQYGGENNLYTIEEVIMYNDAARQHGRVAVANICDDRIIIDLNRWRNGDEHYLLLCESLNHVDYSGDLYCNFSTWLERFMIAQGSKYWYWKVERL